MAFFNETIETMSRDGLRRLQVEKFRAMLGQLWEQNRFYTAKLEKAGIIPADFQALEDLSNFPLTTKLELSQAQEADPPFGTNATFAEDVYTRFHQTSGTTGVPLRVLDTEESWEWWGECWGYVLSGAGLTAEDRLFVPFSFGPFIGFWAAIEGARKIVLSLALKYRLPEPTRLAHNLVTEYKKKLSVKNFNNLCISQKGR